MKKERKWRAIPPVTRWRPSAGDILIGVLEKRGTREGPFGEYVEHLIRNEDGHVFSVTGTSIARAAELVPPGAWVRITCVRCETFTGDDGADRIYREFSVWIEDDET